MLWKLSLWQYFEMHKCNVLHVCSFGVVSEASQADISKTGHIKTKLRDQLFCNLSELTLQMFWAPFLALSISSLIYKSLPFRAMNTLSNLTGQSISFEHRVGCCWDRDCIGLNEVVRNVWAFVSVHWLFMCTLSEWCAVNMPLKYQSKMCGECV